MDFSLFYSDGLHLVEKDNLKLGKSILKAIDSNSNANPYKNAVCFNLNECDFPPLASPATTSKPLYSPVTFFGPFREPIRRLFRSFPQVNKPFHLVVLPVCSVPVSMSHSSLYQPVVASAPCASPVRITTATFPSHIPNICCTDASIRSFSSKLKTTYSLKSSLSSHQKYAPTSANKSPYSSGPACVSIPPVATISVSSHKNSDRAASVSRSNLPSNIAVSSVNSLNSSYVVRTKPLLFKTTKSLVPKSLALFKTSVCVNSSASGTVSNGAVSDSTNTPQSCVALVQHSFSNSKQVADLDSFNSGDIYLSSLSKFSSFVTRECFPSFPSLLVSFLALSYSSKLLLIFYLAFLTFLIRYFLLTQSNCVALNLNILLYIFLLILFLIRRHTNFQKRLNFFMSFYRFLLRKILKILQYFQYIKIYKAMENVGIALFYRICVFVAIISMRLLILEICVRMKV